nr:gdsl esterase/lipase exl3 [Quercus suber]
MFGDSIVDTGNNNGLTSVVKCDFPPYGRDFNGGMPTGRFSNGKVPSDFLVEELGIKDLLPAYRDPSLQPKDLLTGVSFASGGTGYDPLTPQVVSVIPLSEQLQDFKQYIGKLKGIVGEGRTNFILAKSVVFVVASSNDIANTYFLTGIRKVEYDIPSYADLLLNSASNFIKRLLVGGSETECAKQPNQASQVFNDKLSWELGHLNNNLPNAKVVYIDVYNPILDLVTNPKKYGFEIANKGCCGTGTVEIDSTMQEWVKVDDWNNLTTTASLLSLLLHEFTASPVHLFLQLSIDESTSKMEKDEMQCIDTKSEGEDIDLKDKLDELAELPQPKKSKSKTKTNNKNNKRRRTSTVCHFFHMLLTKDGEKPICKCKKCGKEYIAVGAYGIGNLKCHLNLC